MPAPSKLSAIALALLFFSNEVSASGFGDKFEAKVASKSSNVKKQQKKACKLEQKCYQRLEKKVAKKGEQWRTSDKYAKYEQSCQNLAAVCLNGPDPNAKTKAIGKFQKKQKDDSKTKNGKIFKYSAKPLKDHSLKLDKEVNKILKTHSFDHDLKVHSLKLDKEVNKILKTHSFDHDLKVHSLKLDHEVDKILKTHSWDHDLKVHSLKLDHEVDKILKTHSWDHDLKVHSLKLDEHLYKHHKTIAPTSAPTAGVNP